MRATYTETIKNGRTHQHLEVLNCGGGRQSSALVLMACHGEIAKPDVVIMADTGDELKATLNYWEQILVPAMDLAGIPHVVVTREHTHKTQQGDFKVGNIRRDTLRSVAEGSRIANAPFFVDKGDGKKGLLKRACTSEYKIDPINKHIKRGIFGLAPGRRMETKAIVRTVNQWIGIATEESQRAGGNSGSEWSTLTYPLLDLGMSTKDCEAKIVELGYPIPVKSACIGCPFRSNDSWARMKAEQPDAFAVAVDFDIRLRFPEGKGRLNDGLSTEDYLLEVSYIKGSEFPAYIHSSLTPLGDVELPEWTGQDDGAFGGGYC
jgi:hypothetical protein